MEIFLDTKVDELFRVKEPIPISDIPYWTSEYYGFGKYIREYGYYPKTLPLMIFTDHSGPSIIKKFNHFEKSTDAPAVLFHSPHLVEKWKNESAKPCFNLYSPFVFY